MIFHLFDLMSSSDHTPDVTYTQDGDMWVYTNWTDEQYENYEDLVCNYIYTEIHERTHKVGVAFYQIGSRVSFCVTNAAMLRNLTRTETFFQKLVNLTQSSRNR